MKFIKVITFFSLLLITNCASHIEKIEGTTKVETYFLRGQAYLDENMYQNAIDNFTLVKNKYPHSPYAVDAELKIADTYYAKKEYIDAQKLYSIFSDFHPTDKRIDYALFRSAMSFYNMIPSTVDRDLDYAHKSLKEFELFMRFHPNSLYIDIAKEKHKELKTKLAEKELYVAKYYRRKSKFESVVLRYQSILKDYPGIGLEEEAYYGIAEAYYSMGKKEEAKYYAAMLILHYPDSKYIKFARKVEKD
jgi:outer membrane protein assembly factor BamD